MLSCMCVCHWYGFNYLTFASFKLRFALNLLFYFTKAVLPSPMVCCRGTHVACVVIADDIRDCQSGLCSECSECQDCNSPPQKRHDRIIPHCVMVSSHNVVWGFWSRVALYCLKRPIQSCSSRF